MSTFRPPNGRGLDDCGEGDVVGDGHAGHHTEEGLPGESRRRDFIGHPLREELER